MNIDDPVVVVADKKRSQHAHETGKDHQVDAVSIKDLDELIFKILPAIKISVPDDFGRDPMVPGPRQAVGFLPVAEDHSDLNIEISCLYRIYNGLEVASSAGNQDRDLFHISFLY